MRVATNGLAAIAVIGKKLGLVADTDLAHLDSSLERAGQVLDQLSKVDALLREVIKDGPFATMNQFDVDQIHLEPPLGDQFLTGRKGGRTIFADPRLQLAIFGGRRAKNLTSRGAAHILGRSLRDRAEHFAELGSPITPDHNLIAARVRDARQVAKLAQRPHSAKSNDVGSLSSRINPQTSAAA